MPGSTFKTGDKKDEKLYVSALRIDDKDNRMHSERSTADGRQATCSLVNGKEAGSIKLMKKLKKLKKICVVIPL